MRSFLIGFILTSQMFESMVFILPVTNVFHCCLLMLSILQSFGRKLYFLHKNVIWFAHLIPTFGSKFVGLDHRHFFPAQISNKAITSFQFHIEWEEYRGLGKVQHKEVDFGISRTLLR